MIKTLYKEHCLRYFMILEIILVVILLTFFPLSIIFFISYINDFVENNNFFSKFNRFYHFYDYF